MVSDQLSVERAAWAVGIKRLLEGSFNCRERFGDFATHFDITHADSPNWHAKLSIIASPNHRNHIEINGTVFTYTFRPDIRERMVGILNEARQRHDAAQARSREQEDAEAEWTHRQKRELAGIAEVGTISYEIIRSGVNAGCYTVNLFPGHPLERLTLDEVRAFDNFLKTLHAPVSA